MFKEFDSVEDAFEWMRKQEEEANKRLHPAQKRIVRGSYVMRPAPEVPCMIFGYIFTLEEIEEGERQCGADEEELAYTLRTLSESFNRGYRHGRWYSFVEPDGELGDAHISNLWPISEEVFNRAKESGWKLDIATYTSLRDAIETEGLISDN